MKIFTWKQRFTVYLITFGVIGTFLLIGAIADRIAGTHPTGLYIALGISFPFTQLALMNRLRKQVQKQQ